MKKGKKRAQQDARHIASTSYVAAIKLGVCSWNWGVVAGFETVEVEEAAVFMLLCPDPSRICKDPSAPSLLWVSGETD